MDILHGNVMLVHLLRGLNNGEELLQIALKLVWTQGAADTLRGLQQDAGTVGNISGRRRWACGMYTLCWVMPSKNVSKPLLNII